MTNKNIIAILVVVIIAISAYILLSSNEAAAPVLDTPSSTTDRSADTETDDYVGLTVAEAQAKAEADDVAFRTVIIDGEPQPTTRDFRPGRINATVTNGVVTKYSVEGSSAATETETNIPSPTTPNPTPAPSPTEVAPSEINYEEIIGMTTTQAQAFAVTNNVSFRIGSINGEGMPVTMDYRPGRITAEIADGVVTGYTVE